MKIARQIADPYLRQRRFRDKAPAERWGAIKATFGLSRRARQQRHIYQFVTGPYAPPNVTRRQGPFYIAYRPDSDVAFSDHPELAEIAEKWVRDNVDDYANPYWPGIKRAVDKFCQRIPERMLVFGDKSGTAMIRKSVTT